MGAFKGLNRSEVFLTDYNSQKNWEVSGSELDSLGIVHIKAYSGSVMFSNTLYQNYYSGSREDGSFTGSADLRLQTTITIPGARQLPDKGFGTDTVPSVAVFTIPVKYVGIYLKEGSVVLDPKEDSINYVEDDYLEVEEGKKDPFYLEDLRLHPAYDRNGVLIAKGFTGEYEEVDGFDYPVPIIKDNQLIGDVVYSHGIVVVTDPFWAFIYNRVTSEGKMSFLNNFKWTSNIPIYTYNAGCVVRDHEFNCSYNPTAKDLNGKEDFTPYITSIGLYNNRNELLAIAKLSKPIKKLDNIDMTFNVRIDLS